jgi:hypothetical protein
MACEGGKLKTLLFTIASGEKAQQHYDVAGENLMIYARRHGMDYLCIFDVSQYKEPHYAKTYALEAFKQGYECVVYFDIDGVLDTHAPDIRDGLEPSGIYLYNELDLVEGYKKNTAIRETFAVYCDERGIKWDGGKYYNSGVFVAFPDAACILDVGDMPPGKWCHEQHPINLRILQHPDLIHDLPECWNWHRLQFEDRRAAALNGGCFFAHVAGYEARGKDNGILLMKQIKNSMRHRHGKRVIITAITDEVKDIAAFTLPKLEAYAKRCNAELIVLEGMPPKYRHPKYRIFEAAEIDADRYLVIDSDIIVRDNAPDIFVAHSTGNWMIDESVQREPGAFKKHQEEMLQRARRASLYAPDRFSHWWNPGVSLLDREAVHAIYQMPPWAVAEDRNLWDVGNGKRIVKNMPWINYRIAATGTDIQTLDIKWNTIVNRVNNLGAAHFWHCTGSEIDADRNAAKIEHIKNVCAKFNEPINTAACRIHIVMGGDQQGWILGRMTRAIQDAAPAGATVTISGKPVDELGVINYHNNYRIYKSKSRHARDVVFFTHPEPTEIATWNRAAKEADHCVVMCGRYRDELIADRVPADKVTLIYPGVDAAFRDVRLRVFNPSRMSINGEYRKRKGADLWQRLECEPWIHAICSDGEMDADRVQAECRAADVIVSTATMEGGPMSLFEALTLGKPCVISRGVGAVDDFAESSLVKTYIAGDYKTLINSLYFWYERKEACHAGDPGFTWDKWAAAHWDLFQRLADTMPPASPVLETVTVCDNRVPVFATTLTPPEVADSMAYIRSKGLVPELQATPEGALNLDVLAELSTLPRNRQIKKQLEGLIKCTQ